MDKLAEVVGRKVGDAVEDAVKGALGFGDKGKKKDEKKGGGGILSLFGGDKDKKKEKEKDKDKGGSFSKMFHKEDKDEMERMSGFKGLFTEGQLPEAARDDAPAMEGESEEEPKPQSVAVNDRDLLDDLFDVAEETSEGK